MNTIQIKRGENRPGANKLAEFELGFAKAEKELYIGVPEADTENITPIEISAVYIGEGAPPLDSNYKIWVDISNTLPDIGQERYIDTTIDSSGYIDISPITMAAKKGAVMFLFYNSAPYIYLWINNKAIYQSLTSEHSNTLVPIHINSIKAIPTGWLFDPMASTGGVSVILDYYVW